MSVFPALHMREGTRVLVANVLGDVGAGFSLAKEWLTDGRVRCHGSQSVGMARRALNMMMDHAQDRVTFGKPLSQRQAVQCMIANSAMEVHAARPMVYVSVPGDTTRERMFATSPLW